MTKAIAIIVSAGRGVRMGQTTPKQFLQLGERPVIWHTVEAFNECPDIDEIILVAAKEYVQFCKEKIISDIDLETPVKVITGGDRRQTSVFNGIRAINDPKCIVVIHDGVRPFIDPEKISECIMKARISGACILAKPLSDTLKAISSDHHIEATVNREGLWLAQTPQAFDFNLIRLAHETACRDNYTATDDAELVERLGKRVVVIEGAAENIKITTQADLALAKTMLVNQKHSTEGRVTCRRSPKF